jgi:hypothetical protein
MAFSSRVISLRTHLADFLSAHRRFGDGFATAKRRTRGSDKHDGHGSTWNSGWRPGELRGKAANFVAVKRASRSTRGFYTNLIRPWRPGEAARPLVAGQQRGIERFGQGNIDGIIGGENVPKILPGLRHNQMRQRAREGTLW